MADADIATCFEQRSVLRSRLRLGRRRQVDPDRPAARRAPAALPRTSSTTRARTRRGGFDDRPARVDFALLTDGLEAEREQGITIDVAHRFFDLPSGAPCDRRRHAGPRAVHPQHGGRGVHRGRRRPARRRHARASASRPAGTWRSARCMGVRARRRGGQQARRGGLRPGGVRRARGRGARGGGRLRHDGAPSSRPARSAGDNVVAPSPNALVRRADAARRARTVEPPDRAADGAGDFRLPVQYVIRADDFRGFAGTVVGGRCGRATRSSVAGSGVASRIERIVGPGGDLDRAAPGSPVTVTLADDVDVRRGDLLTTPGALDNGLSPASAFSATLVWTAEEPLRHGRSYLLRPGRDGAGRRSRACAAGWTWCPASSSPRAPSASTTSARSS